MIDRKHLLAALGAGLAVPMIRKPARAAQTMKLGHIMSANDPVNLAAQKFADEVKRRTNSEIDIQLFPAGQLGQEREMFESIRLGSMELGYIAGNAIETFEPSEGLFSLPYLFKSYDQIFRVQDGPIGREIAKRVLDKTNVRYLNYGHIGFRDTLTRTKQIRSLADFNGIKIRVPPSPSFVSAFKLLGAIPTAIPGGEMYTALQSGVVDGVEGTPEIMSDFKMFEIAKNYTLTHHIYTDIPLVIAEKTWSSLPAAHQKAFTEAARIAEVYQRKIALDAETRTLQSIGSQGVTLINIDTAPMSQRMTPYYTEFSAKVGGPQLIDAVRATRA